MICNTTLCFDKKVQFQYNQDITFSSKVLKRLRSHVAGNVCMYEGIFNSNFRYEALKAY